MKIHSTLGLLLAFATTATAQQKSQDAPQSKSGDHVYVVRDFANLSVDGKNITQLKWGTRFEIESVSRFDFQGIAQMQDQRLAGSVNRNDVKPILNSQGLIRFICPGMG